MQVSVENEFPDPAVPWVTYELETVHTWPDVVESALQLAALVVPCDLLVWNRIDYVTGGVFARSTDADFVFEDRTVARGILEIEDHPTMNYYAAGGDPWAPVRTSDLLPMREFRSTRAFEEVFHPLGVDHQLTILTDAQPPAVASAWSWNRSGTDFSEDEMARVAAVAAALRTIEHSPTWRAAIQAFNDGRDPEAVRFVPAQKGPQPVEPLRVPLTQREHEVLTHVAEGMTAIAIGHVLRISTPTVRKHLEHMYEKLGEHDRLLAVKRARELGLLR
jgi:DNA-binding CsgD family transcriptional regulator